MVIGVGVEVPQSVNDEMHRCIFCRRPELEESIIERKGTNSIRQEVIGYSANFRRVLRGQS